MMSLNVVLCISVFNFHALSGLRMVLSFERTVSTGVFILEDALMSSSNLGIPSVTFFALFPA